MKKLHAGIAHELRFRVPRTKLVRALYQEAPPFQVMPEVFATGFLVGLVEWACIEAVNPYLDWPNEQTVGTQVNLTHEAPTPAGLEVVARVQLVEIDRRRLMFTAEVHDETETISRGSHERHIIVRDRFDAKIACKYEQAARR